MVVSRNHVKSVCALLVNVLIAVGIFLPAATAQTTPFPATPSPNRSTYVDQNGVDLLTGQMVTTTPIVSIGSGGDGLAVSLTVITNNSVTERRNSMQGMINQYGSGSSAVYVVSLGEAAEEFTSSDNGATFSPKGEFGSDLTKSSQSGVDTFTYTTSNGTVYEFSSEFNNDTGTGLRGSFTNLALITKITTPANKITSFHYYTNNNDTPSDTSDDTYSLMSIDNNLGYQLRFSLPAFGSQVIYGINGRSVYCDPNDLCDLGSTWSDWPSGSYDVSGLNTSTSTGGQGDDGQQTPTQVSSPGQGSQGYSYQNGKVSTATIFGQTWTYNWGDSGDVRTVSVLNPVNSTGHEQVVSSQISTGLVLLAEDELGRTISYSYDSGMRLTRTDYPRGNYTSVTYDARGNATSISQVPYVPPVPPTQSGGNGQDPTLQAITTTAGYSATCGNPKTCNKPVWTKDADGNQTDYQYGSTHGGLIKVTYPSPGSGLPRPEVNYGYTSYTAQRTDGNGGWVPMDSIYRISSVRSCRAGSSCALTAEELTVTQTYRQYRNLLPWTRTTSSGNNSFSSSVVTQYDDYGNPLSVDGPAAGDADMSYTYYDKDHRLLRAVGPDPDDSGARKRLAQQYYYDSTTKQLEYVESGTVTSTGQTAAMTVVNSSHQTYDQYGRTVGTYIEDATGAIQSLRQVSFDDLGRAQCAVLRMNPASFSSMATDTAPNACQLSTAGAFGPDRIVKAVYNEASQLLEVHKAFGTDAVSVEQTAYYANGNVENRIDGNGNITHYEYDFLNRLKRQYYPNVSGGGYNSNDVLVFGYDIVDGRNTNTWLRDGQQISREYDNLGRVTKMDAPGSADDITYTYDNFGNVLTATKNSKTITSTYDALSRKLSETGENGTVSWQYDATTGLGTRITYPGSGLYVNYDYDFTGNVTKIRQNGATSGSGVLASFTFDDLGRRTSLTRGNGVVTNYGFDDMSRLTSLQNDVISTGDDENLTYDYNPAGQMTSRASDNGAYSWDGSNLFSEDIDINGLNQAVQASMGIISHDARGNRTSAGSRNYAYDIYNHLTSVTGAGSNTQMTYDAFGRLARLTEQGVVSKFVQSGGQVIAEMNNSGTITHRYVYGPGADEVLVQYDGTGTSSKQYPISDERGSVIAMTNSSGAVTSVNAYNEYGIPSVNNTGRFQYTGQMWLDDAQVYYYKARAYDPYLGRFLQTDPIGYGDGMNMYAYVGGDPVNRSDPSGLTMVEQTCTTIRTTGAGNAVVRGPFDQFGGCSFAIYLRGGLNLARFWNMAAWGAGYGDYGATRDDGVPGRGSEGGGSGDGDGGTSCASQGDISTEKTVSPSPLDARFYITNPQLSLSCYAGCGSEVFNLSTSVQTTTGALLVGSGAPILPTRAKFGGDAATRGTSIASRLARRLFGRTKLPFRVPAPTLRAPLATTTSAGTFVGRAAPAVGVAMMYPSAREMDYCFASCVRPNTCE